MNAVFDEFLVGAALLASLGYALAKLGPKLWRKRILEALGQVLRSAPAFLKLGGVAQRLDAASGKNQSACGGCDNCGPESSSAPRSSAEIKVPVAKIGRRA
jgi:uncharacterized protein DUF6587